MKTVAIIQARLQSTRLPGKVLSDIAGQTMLQRVVERTARATRVDEVVIATSRADADQELIDYCRRQGWNWVAGSEQDVLSRYVLAARESSADQVVRITSDCPLIEPELIDQIIALRDRESYDYACNFHPCRRFPRGLDCELLTRETLNRIDHLAQSPRYREHVTLYLYQPPCPHGFRMGSVSSDHDWSGLRWTVDTAEDLALVRAIYVALGERDFSWTDVLAAYSTHPQWRAINQATLQKVA